MDDTSATIHPPYYILVSHTLQLNSLIPPPPTSFSHPIIEYHYADDSPHNLLPRSEGELVLVLDHSPTDGADFSARSLTREMAVTGLKVSEAPGAGVVDDGVKDHNMYVLETTVLSEEPLEEECQGPQNILARFKQRNTVLRRVLDYPQESGAVKQCEPATGPSSNNASFAERLA